MSVTMYCAVCDKPVEISASHALRRVTCSTPCRVQWQRRFEVEEDELLLAVWMYPTTAVAEIFGVSDKAIEKRCQRRKKPDAIRSSVGEIKNGPVDQEGLARGTSRFERTARTRLASRSASAASTRRPNGVMR